jgi:hypothetical protein
MEHGLPAYVSKHPQTGHYRYFRRPPKGVVSPVFGHSFGTKDKKVVALKYGAIHAEAEAHFARVISRRVIDDKKLDAIARGVLFASFASKRKHGIIKDARSFRLAYDGLVRQRLDMAGASTADLNELYARVVTLHHQHEAGYLNHVKDDLAAHETALRKVAVVPASKSAFTLMNAYEQTWKPAAVRSPGTVAETKRYVEDFIALNGDYALIDITREHWAKWRAQCLEIHGPSGTAFKRFSMVKTVVATENVIQTASGRVVR